MADDATLFDYESGGEDRPTGEAEAVVNGGSAPVVDASDYRYPDAEGYVELAVTQVDYTVEGSGSEEFPIIHVFGRTADGEVEHVRVREFKPYFYAPTASLSGPPEEQYDRITGSETTDADGEPYESIRGERLTKVFGQTPRDVGQLRDRFDHYEADILFPNRLLIDKDITSGVRVPAQRAADGAIEIHHEQIEAVEVEATPRVCTFDIEVDDRQGFPEDGEETIVCLTSHDSYTDEYVNWIFAGPEGVDPPASLEEFEPLGEGASYEVRRFEDEERMLASFVDYVDERDFDILTGWNFTDFDAPYLLDRLEVLGGSGELDPDRLSRVGEVWRSDWQGPNVKGRVVFDLLYAYKRTQFTELESYRLDAVGEAELGVGKERYPGDIGDLWEEDPERLLEYNTRDVELCVELDRKQEIIPFWQEVASFVGCKLEDAPTPGDAVDMYVLHKVHGEFALPSKGAVDAEEYAGGAVFEPITGVKEMVSVLDLACFSGDTEVLTPDGPRNITDIAVGDTVYTLDPETFECVPKEVTETHEYDNEYGRLHHLSGNTHDFKVTENHRFLVSSERGWDEQAPDDFAFAEYRDIPDNERFAFPQHRPMTGRTPETFDLAAGVEGGNVVVYTDDDLRSFRSAVPEPVTESLDLARGTSEAAGLAQKVGKYLIPLSVFERHRDTIEEHADQLFLTVGRGSQETPLTYGMDDWLALVGWFVTEGSTHPAGNRITIHQSEGADRADICALLDRMGISYSLDDRGVNVTDRHLLEWFENNCGSKAAGKRLPEWVFDLDAELLSGLLETMVRGDGRHTESGLRQFWTTSDRLKDDMLELVVRCGHKPSVSKQSDGTWYVSIGKRGSFNKAANETVEAHDGSVYCITAEDNHVVLAGRNGRFQWVGQSLYPMCMVTINASPETKVDPEGYDGESYHAPNGMRFRKEPDGIIREMVTELLEEREDKKALRDDHEPGTSPFETYDRQQSAVKVIMNCFTPDTEVLTPRGIRGIRELEVGEEVYSLNPETMEMETKPVVETHAYPDYRGELVDIETSKIDFRVTPNHRMLVRKNETNGITEEEYQFVEAGDLDRATNYELPHDWDGPDGDSLETVDLTELLDGDYEVWANNEVHGHTLAAEIGWYPDKIVRQTVGETGYVFSAEEFDRHRKYLDESCSEFYVHSERGRKWIPRFYDGDDFLDLLAWYIAEGHVYTSSEKSFGENRRGSSTTVGLSQDAIADGGEEDDHTAIGRLLDRMGFDAYVDEKGFQFTSRVLGEWLETNCGGASADKRIPEFVFDLSREQKRRFLDTLIAGDGDWQKNSWRYSTTSEQLRNDVLRLCAHLGLTASYSRGDGVWRVYVTETAKNTLRMHRSSSNSTADSGVYCVTVADNNTLLAGRNGKLQFVGQSLYGVLGWDRFRLYDKDMGAAVTATGRRVIEYTEEVASELDRDVIYGDTDSVMLEFGHGMSKQEAIEQSFELEELINESYDELAAELNADQHRFEIEFEKLYRRFFQAGKKKRYAGHIIWSEGKDVDDIDITGFEYKRSDIAPVTKEVQEEVLRRIVTSEAPLDELREEISEYVHDVIQRFKNGEVSVEEVGIPGGIGKKLDNYDTDTAQVRGAKYANLLLGTNFGRGSKPKRVYLDGVHYDFFREFESEHPDITDDPLYLEFKEKQDVICIEYADQLPEEFEVNWDAMLEKTLKGPIARVLEAIDVSWEEVESGQEQTGLEQYF
jgi:DNA polymerase I